MDGSVFTDADLERLRERGIDEQEARRQLALLRRPPRYSEIVRPCTPGDGIEAPDAAEVDRLQARERELSRPGRLKFVPASGAATRMFRDLLHFQRGEGRGASWDEIVDLASRGVNPARALVRFRDGLRRFAFYDDLARSLASRGLDPERLAAGGEIEPVLEALLSPAGLGYAELPKALIKFHRYADGGGRTALEEHLVEAAAYARGADDRSRLHFTVSPEHRPRFERVLEQAAPEYERRLGVRFDVGFSVQKPSTDTLAVEADGAPFRDAAGELVLRPGGHGALIENLGELDGDVVFIKNIDNVQPDHAKATVFRFKRALAGRLLELQAEVFERYRRVREAPDDAGEIDESLEFVRRRLHVEPGAEASGSPEARRRFLLDRLHRPLRVCGVVRNTGEPGGGPFWVRGADGGTTLQIVEIAQVDPDSEQQQRLLRASTHFSPVDLVCGLRDADGRAHDLRRFVDPDTAIVARKSFEGRSLRALERPGLWNGAMAGWNTVFVEVPLETFTPVKTVLDLLRDAHQPVEPPGR